MNFSENAPYIIREISHEMSIMPNNNIRDIYTQIILTFDSRIGEFAIKYANYAVCGKTNISTHGQVCHAALAPRIFSAVPRIIGELSPHHSSVLNLRNT